MRRISLALLLLVVGALTLVPAGPALAYRGATHAELISVSMDGGAGDGQSIQAQMTPDGRYVAFVSGADDLVPNDTNGHADIFVRDRGLGTTTLASIATDGTQGNADASWFAISADGRHVVFSCWCTNLVPGVTGSLEIYERDLDAGTTTLVSQSTSGQPAEGGFVGNTFRFSSDPIVSADGRYVAFASTASNLVPADPNQVSDPSNPAPMEIYLRDTVAGTTRLVSVAKDGAAANGNSRWPMITDDGRFVTFSSTATNLVQIDTNTASDPLFRGEDVYLRDLVAGTTELISVGPRGLPAAGASFGFASMTPDGRSVAFFSQAPDLVPNDSDRVQDVFVRDRVTGTTDRVSISATGGEPNNSSIRPSISADGRYVAFGSTATNLIPDDQNPGDDIYIHDRLTGETRVVSISDEGEQASGQSFIPTLSADGRLVSFTTPGSMVPEDANGTYDIYVVDTGPRIGLQSLSAQRAGGGVDVSGDVELGAVVATSHADSTTDSGTAALGADLSGASISYRPETDDLLVDWRTTSMPSAPDAVWTQPGAGGMPGEVYSMAFTYGGSAWRVSATRVASDGSGGTSAKFTLSKCSPTCTTVASLSGGFGTAGNDVRASVPLSTLTGGPSALTKVSAGVGLQVGISQSADSVDLSDSAVLVSSVDVGAGPAGGRAEDVTFRPATLDRGRFSANGIPAASGDGRLWIRTCVAGTCALDSRAISA